MTDQLESLDEFDLRRMNSDKFGNCSELDKVCVYKLKRTLVESVIEEQYAMEDIDKKLLEQSRSLFEQLKKSPENKLSTSPFTTMNKYDNYCISPSSCDIHDSGKSYSAVNQETTQRLNTEKYFFHNARSDQYRPAAEIRQALFSCKSPQDTPLLPYNNNNDMTFLSRDQGATPRYFVSNEHRLIENESSEKVEKTSPIHSVGHSCVNHNKYPQRDSPSILKDRHQQGQTNSPSVLKGTSGQRKSYPVDQKGSVNGLTLFHTISEHNSSTLTSKPIDPQQTSPGRESLIGGDAFSEPEKGQVCDRSPSNSPEVHHYHSIDKKDLYSSDSSDIEDVFIDVDDSGVPDLNTRVNNPYHYQNSLTKSPFSSVINGEIDSEKGQCKVLRGDDVEQTTSDLKGRTPFWKKVPVKGDESTESLSTSQFARDTLLHRETLQSGGDGVRSGEETQSVLPPIVQYDSKEMNLGRHLKASGQLRCKQNSKTLAENSSAPHQEIKNGHSISNLVNHRVATSGACEQMEDVQKKVSPNEQPCQKETLRRVRGRRKSHVPIQRKRVAEDNCEPSNRQYRPSASNFQIPVPHIGDQHLNSYAHPLSYLYPYPSVSGLQDAAIQPSWAMSSYPQKMAYALPQVSLLNPSTRHISRETTGSLCNTSPHAEKHGEADQVIHGYQSTRPPFTSQRFDANCDEYDPTVLNHLFNQWCASDQIQNQYSSYKANTDGKCSVSQTARSKEANSKPKHISIVENEMTNHGTKGPTRTEINSNEELTQYFNLLFNPGGFKRKDKTASAERPMVAGKEQSEHLGSCRKKQSCIKKVTPKSKQILKKSSSCDCQFQGPKTVSIDLTMDDSSNHSDNKEKGNGVNKRQCTSPDVSGILPINVKDDIWPAGVKEAQETSPDPKMISKDNSSKRDPEGIESVIKDDLVEKPVPKQPYVPTFFQSLPAGSFDKEELLEDMKKWGIGDKRTSSHGQESESLISQSQEDDSGCRVQEHGRVNDTMAGHAKFWGQGNDDNHSVETVTGKGGNGENTEISEKKIPVLDAMDTIIRGLLGQGVVDLSLATQSVNQLFKDKLNGVATPCTCSTKRKPATMSRSMVAHANALRRAKLKQEQAAATFRKSNHSMPMGVPVKSVQRVARAETVFPEMIQEKRPVTQPRSSLLFPEHYAHKAKTQSSTIRHYGPMQMSDNAKKSLPNEMTKPGQFVSQTPSCGAYQQQSKLGSFCPDYQPALFSKAQFPFVLNEYPPFSLVPNAHKMYDDYFSQKRSLEMLQNHFCLPVPVPMKRQRIMFGADGSDLNGPALCSV